MTEPDKNQRMIVTLSVADLEELIEKAVQRAMASHNNKGAAEPEKLLTAAEAAQLIGVPTSWLYSRKLPFAHKLSRKVVRFDETGLKRWLQTRRK